MNTIQAINHFIFPSHTNNFRAKLLHSHVLVLFAVFILALQFLMRFLSSPEVKVLGFAANISPVKVLELTNAARAEVGANSLTLNEVLSEAARKKGLDMLENDYWAHTSPTGTEPWDFFKTAGYRYRYAGENLARDFENPEETVAAWMASPSHKENLLSAKYQEIGIAVVEGDLGGKDTTIIVQFFGTPSSAAPSVPVVAARSQEEEVPVLVPEVKEAFAEEQQAVIQNEPVIPVSSFSAMRLVTIGTVALMVGLLVFDIIILRRHGINRHGGRAFAHLSFMAMVLIILVLIRAGDVI